MALQANPETLRWGASTLGAAGDAIYGNVQSMYNRIVNLVENSQDGWIGDASTAFLSRFEAEVERFYNAANALRQVTPILTYLAAEMEAIMELRRRADQLEAGALAEAAWLMAQAEALRVEANAKAEFADLKGAAQFLAIDLKPMISEFWNSEPVTFIRHIAADAVTWTENTVKSFASDVTVIGEIVANHPVHFRGRRVDECRPGDESRIVAGA